jgi:hypothetical protein
MKELVGQNLGQYRIVEQIGAGGMATVFKAYQPGLDRYVAIKVLPPLHAEQPGFSERFAREAQAIASLNHPNILPVYDSGQEEDYTFIVMRYVEGARTLGQVVKGQLDLGTATEIVGQVAAALDHAHGQGIIHRDVKPSNVLMDGDWALLTDFGLAKMTEATVQITGTGVGVGTPSYMSPEQGQAKEVDNRTDIYSLGIILFEMLTGRIPHSAETPLAIIVKRMTEPLPLPRSINPQIPAAVERVILKALAREPGDRFDSAGEMAEALKQAVSEEVVEEAEEQPTIAAQPPETLAAGRPEHEGTIPVVPVVTPEAERVPTAPPVSAVVPAHTAGFPCKWVAGIGAAVVVVSLCLAGLFFVLAVRDERAGTRTPTPKATMSALARASTETPELAAPALANTPTATLEPLVLAPMDTPTAAPETPASTSDPIYSDDFSQQTWRTYSSDNSTSKYEDDEYHIVVEKTDWEDHEAAGETFSDFALEVTGWQVDGPPGKYGLIFRLEDDDNFYRFGVTNDGLYSVRERLGDEWYEFVEWSYSPAIEKGQQANRLKVVAIGERMAFFVNDEHLITVRDESFSTGDIGVFGATFDEPGVHVAFDDLTVWDSDAPEATIPPGNSVLYFDDFSRELEEDEDEIRIWEYQDGERLVKVKKSSYMSWRDTDRALADFYAEVQVRAVNDVEGEYGIVFREEDDNNFYRFQVSVDGRYKVSKKEAGEWSNLTEWESSSAINKGRSSNVLAVAAQGDEFEFYVNDTYLTSLEDSSFSEGDVGYFGGTFDETGFQVAFDRFVVWDSESAAKK